MFNFGDDDKEKLKENMEDIKEMVDSGESIGSGTGSPDEDLGGFDQDPGLESPPQDGQQAPSQDTSGSSSGSGTESFDTQSFDNDNTSSQQPAQPDQATPQQADDNLEEEIESFEEKFGGEQQAQSQQPQQPQQPQQVSGGQQPEPAEEQRRSRSEKSGVQDSRDLNSLSQEVPSPPETREIDVPDIDRGPLFLRQQKFRRAKQLISEMLYLSNEVESTVNNLEAGIQEDQATERDVREMLKELEGGRSDVEDIISPREE